MLPMVVAGGPCIALSFAFGSPHLKKKGRWLGVNADWWRLRVRADGAGAGRLYRLSSIADRPGLTPGLTGGMLAVSTGSGFIGGIIAGFPRGLRREAYQLEAEAAAQYGSPETDSDHPADFQPGWSVWRMIYLIGKLVAVSGGSDPLAANHGHGKRGAVGAILGGMMCTDMGGPANKAAYAFGVGPAEYPDLRANGSHYGSRYGATAGARPGNDYCAS